MLAIPATVCSGGGNGQAGSLELSGLLIYDVSVKRGFRRPLGTDLADLDLEKF